MTKPNDNYPKEIKTLEKITEKSKDITEVITIVNNNYEEEAVNAAIYYMTSFNKMDSAGCDKSINFPHGRLGMENNKLRVTNQPPQMPAKFFEYFTKTYGWNHSCWDYRTVIQSNPQKIHLQIQFSRYRANGEKIGEFPSLWVITNQDGHWGIKFRSSYAP